MLNIFIYLVIYLVIFALLFVLNYTHKNYHKRICNLNYYTNIILNYTITFILCIFMIKYNLFHEVYFLRIKNIIMYLFILDFMQYWLHRVIHRTACLKTNFHNTHHIEKKLIPLDFIHVDIYEYLVFFLGIHVFIAIFLKISLYEFICSSLIIFAHQYYTHSDSNIDFLIPFFNSSIYHKKHHIIGKGNYAMFFPIWDFIMNTMITKTFKQHRNEIRI